MLRRRQEIGIGVRMASRRGEAASTAIQRADDAEQKHGIYRAAERIKARRSLRQSLRPDSEHLDVDTMLDCEPTAAEPPLGTRGRRSERRSVLAWLQPLRNGQALGPSRKNPEPATADDKRNPRENA